MSHFKIFIPGARGNKAEHLENIGLGDLFAESNWYEHPGDGHAEKGMLVSWATPGTTLEFESQNQDDIDWIEAVPSGIYKKGRYWVLVDKNSPPTPTELARPYQQPGKIFGLGDGNEWMLTSPDALPKDMLLADDGTCKYELQRKFHKYGLLCSNMRDRYVAECVKDEREDEEEGSLQFDECANLVVESLCLNYRATREVLYHLNLFNTGNVLAPFEEIVGGTLSLLGMNEELKGVQ